MNAFKILAKLNDNGITALIVGGAVRDMVAGYTPHDYDIECYHTSMEHLTKVLSTLGTVNAVGKEFGVLKCMIDGFEYDVALARTENRIGVGHRDFNVDTNEHIDPYTASLRRDFTINAMAMNQHGELIDFHDGRNDLTSGILRPVSESFKEDPLRVLRAMQFASRFNMTASDKLIEYAQEMVNEYQNLSVDRVREEWLKWASGRYPHKGLQLLNDTGWIMNFISISNLLYTDQNPKYHPEGDVYTHTYLALKYAGRFECPLTNLSVLCHDMGKFDYTRIINGEVASPGHQDSTRARWFMESIALPNEMIDNVCTVVENHMIPWDNMSDRAVRRLRNRLGDAPCSVLCQTIMSDINGRGSRVSVSKVEELYTRLVSIDNRQSGIIEPVIKGRHLIEAGFAPSKKFGVALDTVYDLQIDYNLPFNELLEIAVKLMKRL